MSEQDEGLRAVLAAEVERRCRHCWRVAATDDDWDHEGTHLCWSPDTAQHFAQCGRPAEDPGQHLADAVTAHLQSRRLVIPAMDAEQMVVTPDTLWLIPDNDDGVLERVRAVAENWANQPTDYDEDTEQQIWDGRHLLDLLNGAQEAHTAPLSDEQHTSEQPDDDSAFGAWIGQAFERGHDEGWGQ